MKIEEYLWYNIKNKYKGEKLFSAAVENKVVLLLKSELELSNMITFPQRKELDTIYITNRVNSTLHLSEARRINKLMRDNSIMPIYFKGDILSELLYEERWRRFS